MAKERPISLSETKGVFQVKGIVTGCESDSFYKESKTKTNRAMRTLSFGVEYQEGKVIYVRLQGMELDNVYFSAFDPKANKSVTQRVDWADRFSFRREGYRIIGCNVGLRKKIDENGRTVNDKKYLTDFDACKECADNLKDGISVFVKGNIEYSSFTDNEGDKRTYIRLVPNQISLCGTVDFADENYTIQNDFGQHIVFMGIDKEKSEKGTDTGRYLVTAKVVNYNSIENAEFILSNSGLAKKIKSHIHPYTHVKVHGHIETVIQAEPVDIEDCWGESDAMMRVIAPSRREFIITGVTPSTIDRESHSRDKMEEAESRLAKENKAKADFGGYDDWGEISDLDDDDESPWD